MEKRRGKIRGKMVGRDQREGWGVKLNSGGEHKRKDGRERSKGGMTSGVLIAEVEIRRKMVG